MTRPANHELSERSVDDRTSRPTPVPPSRWHLPDPRTIPVDGDDESGLIGVGADLDVSTLVHAYRNGVFPWPHGRGALPWFSPHPRGVLPLEKLKVSKTLRQTMRRTGWTATVDGAFPDVIAACAKRPAVGGSRASTWINASMRKAYNHLHDLGYAHSVEVWDGSQLVGGLYGVLVGGVFTGESMFHRKTDASKVAVAELAHRLADAGGSLIDVQLVTEHLESLGAIGISRPLFLDILHEIRDDDVRLVRDRLPVSRLAGVPICLH